MSSIENSDAPRAATASVGLMRGERFGKANHDLTLAQLRDVVAAVRWIGPGGAHHQHDVGARKDIRARHRACAPGYVIGIRKAGCRPRTGFDEDLGAGLDQRGDDGWDEGDPALAREGLSRYADDHVPHIVRKIRG